MNKKYQVEITVTERFVIDVEAESFSQAEDIACEPHDTATNEIDVISIKEQPQ